MGHTIFFLYPATIQSASNFFHPIPLTKPPTVHSLSLTHSLTLCVSLVAERLDWMGKQSYEEIRKQRVEENQKIMEKLHLPHLSHSLKKHFPVKKTAPRIIRKELVPIRRSNRVANMPAPAYKEVVTYERADIPRRQGYGFNRRTDIANRVYASDEARQMAIIKAEELESGLGGGYPTFVKPMTQSHVTGGFWLGLPAYFCRRSLPRDDGTVTLVNEEGEEYSVVYLARKNGLSGGWKGFAVAHELVDGDACVFQLTRPTEFKVYIIRVNSL